jgi:quercetin dioxygenase-like cupin family protein
MKWISTLAVAAALAACGGSTPTARPAQPPPVVKYQNTLPGLTASAPMDLVQSILVFAPGAASIVHTHAAPNLATVLQGQISVKTPSGDKTASTGFALFEPVGQPVQAFNRGSAEAMVAGAFPVPHGAKPTAPVAGAPAPATPNRTLYSVTMALPRLSGGYSVVQQVLDFGPGSQTPRYRLGGSAIVTVLQGQVTLGSDGVETTFSAGDSFTEMQGQPLQAFNRGNVDAILVASYVLPDGAKLTTNL